MVAMSNLLERATPLMIWAGVSCSSGGSLADDVTVVDSAGVTIVTHASGDHVQQFEHARVSRVPAVQIGSVDDEATALYRVTDAVRMANGGIAVANSGSGEIRLFDSNGRFLHSLGGAGGGPGEFGRLAAIWASSSGHLLAYDSQNGRVSTFDPDSRRLIGSIGIRVRPDLYSLAGMRRATPIGWLRDGTFVGYYSTQEGETILGRDGWTHRQYMSNIHFFDRGESSEILATTPGRQTWVMINRTGEGSVRMQGVANPFLPTFETATDGNIVAFGTTQRFDVRLLDTSGAVVRIIRREEGRRPVSEHQRDVWVSGQLGDIGEDGTEQSRRRRELYDDIPFPDTLPAFEALSLQKGGRLWVKETSLDNPALTAASWSVFDSDGRPLGAVELPAGFQPFEIGTDYMLGVWKDDLGVEYVQLYDLADVGS